MFITQPKIFISSTIADLPNERSAALKAVEKVGGFPLMSEFTMEAQSADSLTACLNKVKESDIYILILGGRYGWQPEEKESITELEYQTALAEKKPILVFNTTYAKEQLQKNFEAKVESAYFRKTVRDAFELQVEIEKSLKREIEEKQNEFFNNTEPVYSNLVKISFPKHVYRAELKIDKNAIKAEMEERGLKLKYRPGLFDYVISALRLKDIRFPHDWILWGDSILTFHDLQDPSLPLTEIIDLGTAERFTCEEIYNNSKDDLSTFKFLLKKCLESKLHKLKIKWIREEGLFAFIPTQKDDLERWIDRSAEWVKGSKKATRKVVDIKMNLKNKEEIFNMRCNAFRTRFELFDKEWFLSIKPEWVFLWPDLKVSALGFKNIQWLKKTERNMHVFNHFNFILRYLQPSITEPLFDEYRDYPYLKIGRIEKFDFAPIVPDMTWVKLESAASEKKLKDNLGNVDLFDI
ncbi:MULTISPECIES: DUF4062 domain-containing protein [unclassified Arenibacter]|uniref:DUF4062 domain-containing protein n=1 Tax=unclassified Arenibacter TaxID=2615047 RepID=UPI000E34E6A2|nr:MULTISPECIES: DUF4062 domain-containing protein [unclassified Arenibacter]MCM4162769.1 hypothetical protein [Arenibacter sp. A80]RFT56822.1 DUF4062 domain-containing protein [Arenibacter sp. P308M17]